MDEDQRKGFNPTIQGLQGHPGRPQSHGPDNSRKPKKFWEESHMTPLKFFGAWVYVGQRESMTGGDMDGETRYDDSWGWG